jgi:predicted transport protein
VRYENDIFELRRVASSQAKGSAWSNKKQISKVNYTSYSIESHIIWKNDLIKELFLRLQEKIFSLEWNWKIEEKPRQEYIAYSTSKNFVELLIQNQQIKLYLDISYNQLDNPKAVWRDVSNIGHLGTWSSEILYKSLDELDYIVWLIEQSYLQSV